MNNLDKLIDNWLTREEPIKEEVEELDIMDLIKEEKEKALLWECQS